MTTPKKCAERSFRYIIFGLLLPFLITAQTADPDSLHTVADSLLAEEQFEEALKIYSREIEIRRDLGDTAGWSSSLGGKLEALVGMGNFDGVLELAEEALELTMTAFGPEDSLVATWHNNVGFIHMKFGSYHLALDYYQKALEIHEKIHGGRHSDVATDYDNIGALYFYTGDYEQSVFNLRKALEIRLEALGADSPQVSGSYNNLGVVYSTLGRTKEALENYEKALEIDLKLYRPDHPELAISYSNIGTIYQDEADYEQALEHFQKSLDIRLKAYPPDHPELFYIYNNLGTLYDDYGLYNKALDFYERSLATVVNSFGEEHPKAALVYENIGVTYAQMGIYQKALDKYRKSLDILNKIQEPGHPHFASNYSNIGITHLQLGAYPQALENITIALEIATNSLGPKHLDVAWFHSNIGVVYGEMGNHEKALDSYRKALDIKLELLESDHPSVATTLSNIAADYTRLDSLQLALDYFKRALDIRQKAFSRDHPSVALSYHNIGMVYLSQGRFTEALETLRTSLEINLATLGTDKPQVADNYADIGEVHLELDEKDSALVNLGKAIDIYERSRSQVAEERLRETFTEKISDDYDAIISLLLDMDRPQEAFEYMERSKSKTLQNELNERYDIDFGKGTMSEKLAESKELVSKAESLEVQLILEKQKPDSLRSELRVENLSQLLADTKAEYLKVAASIRTDPDYAFTVQVHPSDLGVISNDLPEGQKLLMFYSGKNELYLFGVSKGGYEVRSVPISRDSLDELVNRCRQLCFDQAFYLSRREKLVGWSWEDDGSDFYKSDVSPLKNVLSLLYSYLVKPFEAEFLDAEIVSFIPSGTLYYLPWAALIAETDSLTFLSERFNWNVLTSTEILECIYRRQKRRKKLKSLALVGNPTGAGLPSAETEVTSIGSSYRRSTILIGNNATETQVAEISPDAEALHLATHCILKSDNPLDSYIHLARTEETDGHWTVTEVWGQSWEQMQLVTLSACETAVGGTQPGLEFVSMAKAFSLAMEGPPAIVATLWPVADESTKEFMVTFYNELKTSAKSEALRRAQMQLIGSEEYAHPFFWAPFILIGEWR